MTRIDALPEGTDFTDGGCNLAPSCLNCPLPLCKYDMPTHILNRAARDNRIYELRKSGVPPKDIRRAYGIAQRTLYRIMQRGGASAKAREWADKAGELSPLELQARSPYRERAPWPEIRRVS